MELGRFVLRSGRTVLHFGPGSVSALEGWLSEFKRVHVVTSRSAARISGALGEVSRYLDRNGIKYEVYDGVVPNPSASLVDAVAERIWRFGAEAVIAIGGGSVIDVAKLGSAVAACGGRAAEYLRRERSVCGALKIAAINLTHGTGSEVDRFAVATVDETREKVSVASDYIYPSIAVDDPRYLTTLPRSQTVYTALDALYHALESSTSRASSPFTRTLAQESVRLILRWLPEAVEKPENLEARYWLLYASALSGICVDNSRTHFIHAIEHVLSGLEASLAHGAGLAALGPAAVRVLYASSPGPLHELLKHVDPSLSPSPEDAERAADALRRFQERVGFRESLADYGFTAEMAEKVADSALKSMRYLLDLAPVDASRDLVKRVYLESLAGHKK